ncbi:MAG: RodZ domain-containing protein [Parcubacteria group bacterium]|jgi:cytoskeletal protein RodZ
MMRSFTKKSVGTLTLGEKLKKLRSERRMSLGEASRQTMIQAKYLEYLEEGVYAKLPVDVYVRGFLRSYAEFLGVEEKVLLRMYDKEIGIRKNLDERQGVKKEKKEAISVSSFVFTPKMLAVSLAFLLVFGGFFYLYNEIGSFASTPRLVILSPDKNYVTDGNSVTVEGVTDRDAKLFLNGAPILVSDDGKFREGVTVQSGTNVISIRAVNKFNKEATETLNVQSNLQDSQSAENSTEPAAQSGDDVSGISNQKGLEMEVRVDPGPIWVSAEVDGNLVFSGTMLTGAIQAFKADSKIVLNSGKGNATFVKFNGKDIGALSGNAGAVRGVTFTADTKY